MCIALQKRSVKTEINCKEKDQNRTSKAQNSLSAVLVTLHVCI